MKQINWIYLIAIGLCFLVYQMNRTLSNASAFFYGFAENKETELSHDKPVLIHKIFVTPGQEVTKGQLLMEVKQSSIDFKIDNASLDLAKLGIVAAQERQRLENRIHQLRTKRMTRVAEIELEIKNLEATIRYNQDLLKDLKSMDTEKLKLENSPNAIKLTTLKESLALAVEPIDLQIAQLEKELSTIHTPAKIQQQKLKEAINYYKGEQEQLAILAPSDGLIGNVLCKEGENISAFNTLINFYDRHPTIVKGFVHESLILQVKVGDSLKVSSSLHPMLFVGGQVTGLGSRIVEIPERLRKIPEHKTYGREVLIGIPADNPFLQKEKVMLNSLNQENSTFSAYIHNLFNLDDYEERKLIDQTISSAR